jgi:hypothetical protein
MASVKTSYLNFMAASSMVVPDVSAVKHLIASPNNQWQQHIFDINGE